MYKTDKGDLFMNAKDIGKTVWFTVGNNNPRSGKIMSINGKRSDTCPVRHVRIEDDQLTYQTFSGVSKAVSWDVKPHDLILNETGDL